MRSDHKALLFLGGIAVLGATVRVARAVGAPAAGGNAALEHQMQAADSAKRSVVGKRADKARRPGSAKAAAERVGAPGQSPANTGGRSEHRDYKGRLDLDVATAVEIDSLPGMGPALATRIVADRMVNGAFRELTALRRVRGVSAKLLVRLDSIVSFSGAYKPAVASDTIIPTKGSRKQRHRS